MIAAVLGWSMLCRTLMSNRMCDVKSSSAATDTRDGPGASLPSRSHTARPQHWQQPGRRNSIPTDLLSLSYRHVTTNIWTTWHPSFSDVPVWCGTRLHSKLRQLIGRLHWRKTNSGRNWLFQKSSPPLTLFGIFSFRLSLFVWNFAYSLAIHIHIYLRIFADLS